MYNDQQSNSTDTNMILSSKLLQEMMSQVKDGQNRIEILSQSSASMLLIIRQSADDNKLLLTEIRHDIKNSEDRIIAAIKESTSITNKDILAGSKQHEAIIKIIEDIDNRSSNILTDKIKLIVKEIGNNSSEHKTITAIITDIDDRTSLLIKDKNIEVLDKINDSFERFESMSITMGKILDKLSILDNKLFRIFSVSGLIVICIGVIGGLSGLFEIIFKFFTD